METILYNISQVLGITIIHSLWQGLLIYFILRIAFTFLTQLQASKKYLMAVTSLFAITGWFVYTLISEINIYSWMAVRPTNLSAMPLMLELPVNISHLNEQSIRYYYNIEKYLPYITIFYVAGFLFNTSRLILIRKKISTIKQTMSLDIALQLQVNKFSGLLNIGKKVQIGLSKLVDVPCMAGYIKPVILLPFTLSTYLSTEEIEAILFHELAHIKRNDYMVNMLQQILSILLFFNPSALLISRIINEERENCCDDLVVKATANPIIYAKALLKLEQTRETNQQLALAATGKKYHLLNRIERIMKTKKQTSSMRPALAAMLILTIGIGCIALLNPQIAQGKISVKVINPVIDMFADTGRKTTIKKTGDVQAHSAKKTIHTTKHKNADNENADNADNTDTYTAVDEDKKLHELSMEVQKHSEALQKYYNSDEFKAVQKELQQKGSEIQEFYNRPELKKMQEDLSKSGKEFSKNWGENDESRSLGARMGEAGRKIGTYFKSKEFKEMNSALKKKYGIPDEVYYNGHNEDENYKKYQAELESKLPPAIKQQTEELKKMGEQMKARYESPEYKAQNRRLTALGDSLNKAYNNPEIKEQQKELERLGRQLNAAHNNPQLKKEQQLLNEAVRKMNAYINSPEYKKYLNHFKYSYRFKFNDDKEMPEVPEKPEAPNVSAPNAPEVPNVSAPTAPNKPEAPEKPEVQ